MINFLHRVIIGAGILLSMIIPAWHNQAIAPANKQVSFGDVVYSQPALFETSLAAGIGPTDTSMTLVNGTLRDGTTLSGNYCFTIDAGQTNTEYVCGTASGTSVTNLIRGIGADGVTSYSALEYSHRYGADVKITDFSNQQYSRILNGVGTFPNVLSYNSSSTTQFTLGQQIPNKAYVDSVALSGAPPASTSTGGTIIYATPAQTAAGTATSSYSGFTFYLSPLNSSFGSTPAAATMVPVTQSNGTLATGFINQAGSYDWTGSQTFASSTTFNASSTTTFNGSVTFPSTPPTISTSTFTTSTQAVNKGYVDSQVPTFITATNGWTAGTTALNQTIYSATTTINLPTVNSTSTFIGSCEGSSYNGGSVGVQINGTTVWSGASTASGGGGTAYTGSIDFSTNDTSTINIGVYATSLSATGAIASITCQNFQIISFYK